MDWLPKALLTIVGMGTYVVLLGYGLAKFDNWKARRRES